MSSDHALAVVRRYHEGWTSGDYEKAIGLLAPTLEVEVPINQYRTAESFAQALRGFGSIVRTVELLSEMSDGDEAMLLYDMHVQEVGQLRVAEHFTISDGKIARLRQIHDTAPVRAAGLAQASPGRSTPVSRDYARECRFAVACERVFEAVTTLEGIGGWWTTRVRGNPSEGGQLELIFARHDQKILLRVDEATSPSKVVWTCTTHTGHPEWKDTRIVFELIANRETGGTLRFRHIGLTPTLSCYDTCESGWDHFLTSLLSFAQHGTGSPY
ncbi:MAG: hypothetical protein QOF83_1737 [Solirubrobacteraceae bacterium]|nr:hypothetical protein [Solirubrobacteraceae bacterium]